MVTQRAAPLSLHEAIEQEVANLTEHEGGLWRGDVPLYLIDDTDVPVNQANLELIAYQLEEEAEAKGNDGQLQPIMLGLVERRVKLPVIDGFHRFDVFKIKGRDTIFSTIVEVTEEELLDKRIQNTRNHSGLQFARATQWVREAWALNPFSGRIEASQAFTLGRLKSSTGSRLGLGADEADQIMAWVDEKSALWGVEPMTIYAYLQTDRTVASDLVHNSRPDAKQSSDPNSLPQSTLQRIGRTIPGREELQRAVASAIVNHKLGGSGISGILSDIKGMTDEQAQAHLAGVDFAAYRERIAEKPVYKYPEDDILRLDKVRESSRVRPLAEIATLTATHVELVLDEGGFDEDRMRNVSGELIRISGLLTDAATKIDNALGDKSKNSALPNDQGRSIDEFTELLTGFLRDSSQSFDIKTDREALSVQRAIDRGRGTQASLKKLNTKLNRYRAKSGK